MKMLLIFFLLLAFTINAFGVDAKTEKSILDQNWGLKKIDVEKSWSISQGNKKIIIAIIDTGMDINHPELKNNLWVNPKEISDNRIDDDGNGFIDDVHGWNFVTENNKPLDSQGHGTHIAGIIHGVAPKASFMVLKYFDPKSLSDKNITNTVRAIDYAVNNGAQIINYSGGGFGKNPLEEMAIKRAKDKNILFVAAAGNEATNSDKNSFYPASYDLSNIISVASLTQESNLVESSNFGIETVDIAAPGKNIYSALPGGRYGFMTGTSQATAFATGVLAMMLTVYPDINSAEKLIQYLVSTGSVEENLNGKTKYKTKLNSYRALAMKGKEVDANGLSAENTKQINADIFSSESSILDANLDSLIKNTNTKNRIRIPAQQ